MRRMLLMVGLFGITAVIAPFVIEAIEIAPEARSTMPDGSKHPQLLAAPGWVEPASEELILSAELRGRLVRIAVDEGESVRAGQVLAIIDDVEYVARVQQAKAVMHQRQAELEKLNNGARVEERRRARAELKQAEAELEIARRELARRQPLAKTGHTSRKALDNAELASRVAEARVESLTQALALIEAPPRSEDVDVMQARLALAIAKMAEAEATLARTRIVSPIDGTVLHRARNEGEGVTDEPPTMVFRVGDLSRLYVRADIDETDVARVVVGQQAFIKSDAFPERRFPGRLSEISPRLGRKTLRTDEPTERLDTKVLEVLIELDPDTALPVGLRVDAFIVVDPAPTQ